MRSWSRLDDHRPAGYDAAHFLLFTATKLTDTFCRRTSGNVTSDPRDVTCPVCQRIILRAWLARILSDARQTLATAVADWIT